jgi:hypothetical protein
LKPLTARKIEIGWIGRHLYRPLCPKRETPLDCKRLTECPLNTENPKYDPDEKNRFTNYLKQWSEIPPPEADESEKSSENLPENH